MPIQPGPLAELFSSRSRCRCPGLARRPAAGAGLRAAGDRGPGHHGDRPGRSRAGRAGLRREPVAGSPLQYYVMLRAAWRGSPRPRRRCWTSNRSRRSRACSTRRRSAATCRRPGAGWRPAGECPRRRRDQPGPPRCASSTRPRRGDPDGQAGRARGPDAVGRHADRRGRRRRARLRSRPEREPWSARLRAPAGSGAAISYFLVSGGRRYALASQSVAAMLGYDLSTQAVLLPARRDRPDPAGARARPCEWPGGSGPAGSGSG